MPKQYKQPHTQYYQENSTPLKPKYTSFFNICLQFVHPINSTSPLPRQETQLPHVYIHMLRQIMGEYIHHPYDVTYMQ